MPSKAHASALARAWFPTWLSAHGRDAAKAFGKLSSLHSYVSKLRQRNEFWRRYAEVLEAELAAASARAWDVVAEVPLRSTWESVAKARLRGEPDRTALVWADLDCFKEVNDTYGHIAGDAVLREVARRLDRAFADGAPVVTRLGGDEFGVVIRDLAMADLAGFSQSMSTPIDLPYGQQIVVRASVGVAKAAEQNGHTLESLLRVAEAAAYAEKQQANPGRGRSRTSRRGAVLGVAR